LFPLVLIVALAGGPAGAYTVDSGFSDPCHEKMIGAAYRDFILDLPMSGMQAPPGETWRELSDYLLEHMPLNPDEVDEVKRFILVSLIIGVRAPDTDGHSIMNLQNLRRLHSDPSAEGQYAHSLRAADDDYAEGDAAAVAGTRELILALMAEAQRYKALPSREQTIKVKVYFDFYGRIDVDVWAPLYFAGKAAHVLQDTFSHTIRSDEDDLRKIVHVLNYIDAITEDFDEDRDGLAHSDSMDRCLSEDAADLFDSAVEATTDLFFAMREQFSGRDPQAVLHVLDTWVTYKAGCTKDNEFCGNTRWLALVRKEQTKPYVKAIFGCGGAGPGRGRIFPALLLILVYFSVRYRKAVKVRGEVAPLRTG
jgi:hypothetical protein